MKNTLSIEELKKILKDIPILKKEITNYLMHSITKNSKYILTNCTINYTNNLVDANREYSENSVLSKKTIKEWQSLIEVMPELLDEKEYYLVIAIIKIEDVIEFLTSKINIVDQTLDDR